jgi:serine/threonine protein kinase
MSNKKIRNFKNNNTLDEIIKKVISSKRTWSESFFKNSIPEKNVYIKSSSSKNYIATSLQPYLSNNLNKFKNIKIDMTKDKSSGSFGSVYLKIKSKNNKDLNIIYKEIYNTDSEKTQFKALIFHYLLQKYYTINNISELKYLCKLHEFGSIEKNETLTYAIMENCGKDLLNYFEDIIEINKNLSLKEKLMKLLILFSECCKAVKIIHNLGYLHLDIKPENFMIKDDQIKIIDFDCVKKSGYKTITSFGTMNYISNDWLINAYSKHPRETTLEYHHDIFSLGCMFIYLLYNCVFDMSIDIACPNEIINYNSNFDKNVIKARINYKDEDLKNITDFIRKNLVINDDLKVIIIVNLINKIVNPDVAERYESIDNVIEHIDSIIKKI